MYFYIGDMGFAYSVSTF